MASVQVSSALPKKSFAQVAAAANIPIILKEKPANKPNQVSSSQPSSKGTNGSPGPRQEPGMKPVGPPVGLNSQQSEAINEKSTEIQQLNGILQRSHMQELPLRLATVEDTFKKETDAKSVASRTTLTLDEKESLRPDDSASVQAAAEEDAFSPSGSVVAGSRGGSDPDARAFRDQLNAIDRTGAAGLVQQQLPAPVVVPVLETRNGGIIYPVQLAASGTFNVSESPRVVPPRVGPGELVNTPDEKLLEALASPKDRLFVLKIEQDMIDFVRDSQEEFLQLPQTNSFYRMLSHKLADYYLLGHIIDESMTSVRIFRTPHARLPPPLIGPASSADGSTPPPTAPARQIMRRMVEGQAQRYSEAKHANSQTPSSAPSDNGAGSGGDDGNEESNKKDKNTLTREERENRYKEARARIFKDFKEDATEPADGANGTNEKEVSRSSSASGVKKGKKHRKPKDDGFEARSAYSQYGNQTFSPSGLNTPASDGSFYNPFAPYAVPDQNASASRNLESAQQMSGSAYNPYNQQASVGMNAWGGLQQMQGYPIQSMPATSNFHSPDNYDAQNIFGTSLQSFPSPNMSSQLTPKVATQSMYSHEYMSQPENMGWSNGQNFNNPYGASGMMYNGAPSPDTSFMPNQGMYPSSPGPYGEFPMHEQQYYPQQAHNSAFSRQQFNPRSQVFTPSLRGGPATAMQPNQNFAHPPVPPQFSSPIQRQVSSTSQGLGFGSPHFSQGSPGGTRMNNNQIQSRPQAQVARQPSSSFPSSISKWGTPSTLPPKPPPPAIQSPFFELPRDPQNSQPLPPNPFSSLVRPSSNNNVGLQVSR